MIDFYVFGTPAPQGSKKHVGNGIMVESSKKVKPWRKAIADAFLEQYKGQQPPIEGACAVLLAFTLKKPASAPKTRQTFASKRPDLDKLVRSTFDGITQAGMWLDDSQCIELTATKHYPNEGKWALPEPGVIIQIKAVEDGEVEKA